MTATTTETDNCSKDEDQEMPITAGGEIPLISTRLPNEIVELLLYLSTNPQIIFKSQQRNDPELLPSEKMQLAQNIYQRNPQTFLLRFGCYLKEQHLKDFARHSIADSDEEMHQMVKEYENKLKSRQQDVKNRRYVAMQNLIREGDYFSEQEMMKRAPVLYEELVGQYLSRSEKEQRDGYNVRTTSFSGILMHSLEQNEMSEVMKKAKETVEMDLQHQEVDATSKQVMESTEIVNADYQDDFDDTIPENYRHQWGNFDNETVICSHVNQRKLSKSVNKMKKPTSASPYITAEERALLKQEFLGVMYEQFLTGQDKDFDYTTVDDNTQYDDLQQINQDREDRYFDESDEDDPETCNITEELISDKEHFKGSDNPNGSENSESEPDELEIYMNHLNQHHSLQLQH